MRLVELSAKEMLLLSTAMGIVLALSLKKDMPHLSQSLDLLVDEEVEKWDKLLGNDIENDILIKKLT